MKLRLFLKRNQNILTFLSSISSELANDPQTALQRDNVEDDLDAEMPSSPPTPASASNANLLLSGANGSINGKHKFLSAPTSSAEGPQII